MCGHAGCLVAEHNWPLSVSLELRNDHVRGGDDGVLRTQFPGGQKSRPRQTAPPPEQVTAVFVCDRAELQTLLDFWRITLNRVMPFNYRDRTKPDEALAEFEFVARPSYQSDGQPNHFRVTVQLQQLTTFQGTFLLTESAQGPVVSDGDDALTT